MSGSGSRQQLAGVVVNSHPNVPREEYDRLRATLRNCIRFGPASQNRADHPHFRAHLLGKIGRVHMLNPARGEKLKALFQQIPWSAAATPE